VNIKIWEGFDEHHPVTELCLHGTRLLVEQGADLSLGSDAHKPMPPEFTPSVLRVVRESGLAEPCFARVLRDIAPKAR